MGGVVVVTCFKLCCLWISLFLCQVLPPPPPPLIMGHGGRLGLSRPQTTNILYVFIHSNDVSIFCFASAALFAFMSVKSSAITQTTTTRRLGNCGGFTLQAATGVGAITLCECI